jgi:hypothetical protein
MEADLHRLSTLLAGTPVRNDTPRGKNNQHSGPTQNLWAVSGSHSIRAWESGYAEERNHHPFWMNEIPNPGTSLPSHDKVHFNKWSNVSMPISQIVEQTTADR